MHVHTSLTQATSGSPESAVEGVYEREGVAPPIVTRECLIASMQADRYNYTCLWRRFKDLMRTEFYSIAHMGGMPKMASIMTAAEITVYAATVSAMKKAHKPFLELYPTDANVTYEKKQITHPNFTPNAEVAVLCHVLQGMTYEQGQRLVENLEVRKVVVYGPNVGRATGEGWCYYKYGGNQTFYTIAALRALVEAAGYRVKICETHYEDVFLFAEK